MFWTVVEALLAVFVGLPILLFILSLFGSAITTKHGDWDH